MLLFFVYIILYVPTNIVSTSLRSDGVLKLNKMVFKHDLARMDNKPHPRTSTSKQIKVIPYKKLAEIENKRSDYLSSNAQPYKHITKTEGNVDSSAPFEDNTYNSDGENLYKLIREVVTAKIGKNLSEPQIQLLISQAIEILNNERDTSTYDSNKPTLRSSELNNRLNGMIKNLIASKNKLLAVKKIDLKNYRNEDIWKFAAGVKDSVVHEIAKKVTNSGFWSQTPIHNQRKYKRTKSTTIKSKSMWPSSTENVENAATNNEIKKFLQHHYPFITKSNTEANFNEEKKKILSHKQRNHKGTKSTIKKSSFTLSGSTDNAKNSTKNERGKTYSQNHRSLKTKLNTPAFFYSEKKIIAVTKRLAHNQYRNIYKSLLKSEDKFEKDHRIFEKAKQKVKYDETKADTGIIQGVKDPEIHANKGDSTTKENSNDKSSIITGFPKQISEIASVAEKIHRNFADLSKQSADIESEGENIKNNIKDLQYLLAEIDPEGENTTNCTLDLRDQSGKMDPEEKNTQNSTTDLQYQSAETNFEGENLQNSTTNLSDVSEFDSKGENTQNSKRHLRDEFAEMDLEGENTQNSQTDLLDHFAEMDSERENVQNSTTTMSNESGIVSKEEKENSQSSKEDLRDKFADIDSEGENTKNSKSNLRDQSAEMDPDEKKNKKSVSDLSYESKIYSEGENTQDSTLDLILTPLQTETKTNKYVLSSPHYVRDDAKVKNFTKHALRESLQMLNNMANLTATRRLKKQIAKIFTDFKYEFLDFAKKTMSHKILTNQGTQKVILNTLDTSIHILKNKTYSLMDLIKKKRKNGSLRDINQLKLKIDQLEDSHYKYACTLGISRSNYGFSKFLIDILTETLISNDRKLHEATDMAIELLKNTDLSTTADNATKAKIKEYFQFVENLPIKTLRSGIETLKNILFHRSQSTEADEKNSEASLLIQDFLDQLENTIGEIDGSKVLLGNLTTIFNNWLYNRGKIDDLDKVRNMIENFILDAISKMNEDDLKSFSKKLQVLMTYMEKNTLLAQKVFQEVPLTAFSSR